ncbi:MAG: flagellin [Synergistaceae bacterium]|jgi:flagellin|nr:flagellin [Synergistaceae bacterium]
MRIYHNIPALYAQNALSETNNAIQKSIRTLSTGLRINSAADDAAGLAVSEKMRSQISGLGMAIRNAQDGVSMIQTAEGALTETHAMLQRMRELAVQAANDTLTQQDRQYIQLEIDELKDGVDRIARTTQFNKKRLLDGSSAAIFSSDKLNTKAYVRGSLRQVDRFGQKAAFEGNYKITIDAKPGQTQIQKTDIFTIKHENVVLGETRNVGAGVVGLRVDNLPAGAYIASGSTSLSAASRIVGLFNNHGVLGVGGLSAANVAQAAGVAMSVNASVLFEVTQVNAAANTMTVRVTASVLTTDGQVYDHVRDGVVISLGSPTNAITGVGVEMNFDAASMAASAVSVGHKMVVNITAGTGTAGTAPNVNVGIRGAQNPNWEYKWGTNVLYTGTGSTKLNYGLNAAAVQNSEVQFRNFYVNANNGTVYEGNVILGLNGGFDAANLAGGAMLASFNAAYVGQTATHDTALRDINKFWNSQGVFMLTDPQTIKISQGNGKSTSITIYSTDTLEMVRDKLNDAIANGLGQAQYALDSSQYFATFVDQGYTTPGIESVAGTMVIRSMVAGTAGEFKFSGDEDLINALSLNAVQESKENSFTVSVHNAHTSVQIAGGVNIAGNMMVGIIHPNVDIEFDPMANIRATWSDAMKSFVLEKEATSYTTVVHLVDNSTVFQVGANSNEDVTVDIGNMTSAALGIERVIVTDRESAGRAIMILDSAISRVSSQRARLGAYHNSLEYTATNLKNTNTNLTAAESRIRDADMSAEMLDYTRLQILSQSGTAMLAQANQLPQTVLSLLR